MTTTSETRWTRIEDIVRGALQRPAEERSEFLDNACGSDVTMRRDVETVLSVGVEASAGSPNTTLAGRPEISADAGPEPLAAGRIFEQRFELLRLLGMGGMGLVWLAQQLAPVRRPVALKLIRAGMYDESIVRRFQSERQSLAMMEHPAIAKVFEAGATPQGQPYFVMEYVPGRPIDNYCEVQKLGIPERLELFIQVCEGVQHAHQKAIIHRDLKPPNILIMEVDGKPVPRIIDFGLAKPTRTAFSDEAQFTQIGHFMGTPGYMSPEQVDGQDVDTRADVYALGVILYVLLAGSLPFDLSPPRRQPLDELLRRLREEEPPRPSTKIMANRVTSMTIAGDRGASPKQLVRQLRADLDWITLKALERDRERRYATPLELAADLRRYLNHEPVSARPDSVGYQFRKFVRRNRVATIVAGLVSIFAIAAAAAGLVAVRQRNIALAEQAAADHTAKFMVSLFKIADPGANRGSSITVREILDRGAASIGEGLEKEPDIQADLLTAMGQAYSGLGLFEPATKLLREARADQDNSSVSIESKLRTLSASGANAYLLGDYPQADQLLQQAMEIARKKLRSSDVLRSEIWDKMADVQSQLGNDKEAVQLAQEALAADRLRGPEQVDTLATTLDTLGSAYFYAGDLAKAETIMREALSLHERLSGPRHALTGQAMENLAAVLYQRGRYDENMALMRQVLPIYREVYGPEHPEVAVALYNLGRSTLMAGHPNDAVPYLRQSVAMTEKLKGLTNDDLISPLNSLAMIDAFAGRGDAAYAEIQRAEQIARLPDHGALLDQVLLNEADFDVQSGEVNQAEARLNESHRLLEAKFPLASHPDESWRYAICDTVEAEILARQGDAVNARAKIAAALPVIGARFGTDGFHTVLARRREQLIEGYLGKPNAHR